MRRIFSLLTVVDIYEFCEIAFVDTCARNE